MNDLVRNVGFIIGGNTIKIRRKYGFIYID